MKRKFSFEEDEAPNPNVALALAAKREKLDRQSSKLLADEKRWLRKKRLANTKLKKITSAKRRLRARRKAFEKQLKGQV